MVLFSFLGDAIGIAEGITGAIGAAEGIAAPLAPLIKAAAGVVGQSDIGKAVKDGIDQFFDGMPVFMSALDEVGSLHPFIGGMSTLLREFMCGDRRIVVVMAFKTVYTLEQKRRDNEKKIIALYVEMKDMMGVLLL
jgi:hypothetical protein